MENTLQSHLFARLPTYWHESFSRLYRAPVILTSCAALLLTPLIWQRLTYKPRLLPPITDEYKYRLNDLDHTSRTLTLSDGRAVGYAEFGDLKGKPIIVLHGILGSRLENALYDESAKELGARIIGIDRPGIGLSSPDDRPLKERRLIDHSKDVEDLAEHLELNSYAIIGTSGGGPYALGCAYALPSSSSKPTLKAVAIVTGQGLADMSQAWPAFLVFLNKHLNLRWLLRMIFGSSQVWDMSLLDDQRAELMRQSFDIKKAHPADVNTARLPGHPDMVRIFLHSSRQAIAKGWDGFLDDAAVTSADPGFCVEDIRSDLPVHLWYGTDDTNVSPQAGVETADRLRVGGNRNVVSHMKKGETHGSTQVKYRKEVLMELLRIMNT